MSAAAQHAQFLHTPRRRLLQTRSRRASARSSFAVALACRRAIETAVFVRLIFGGVQVLFRWFLGLHGKFCGRARAYNAAYNTAESSAASAELTAALFGSIVSVILVQIN